MGNRAVIVSEDTTKENKCNRIGLYVHWNGSEEDVKAVLKQCKEARIRSVSCDDSYFWARFCQAYANYISDGRLEETSIGIGIVEELDYCNGDNGVYYIDDNFEIARHTDGAELADS